MTKKEDRLSPVARRLLTHAENLASAPHPDNEKIVNYLQSVSPEKLTLYDRQKIGREILARKLPRRAGEPTNTEIREAYDLGEHKDFSPNRKDIIKKMLEGNACFKKGSYGCSAQDYREAAIAAKDAGFYDLAIKGYERAIKTFDEADKIDGQRLPKNYRGGWEYELAQLKEQQSKSGKSHSSGLEKSVTSVIAIVGVLGGIFFLSNNITGNAIADLSTKTTSFLGAGLLIVGLVAGFFWIKSRKK